MSKLGKGLEALIKVNEEETKQVNLIDIKKIRFNLYQPRKETDNQKLQELANSISENGIIQPVIVREIANEQYELIAGQRRVTAAKLAGFEKVPAIIRSAQDQEMLEFSIVENIQREDLNPMDEARAYEKLVNEFQLTHNRISEIVGKNRATITNTLRILKLPSEVRELVAQGRLSAGHARAILQVRPDLQIEFANFIVQNAISVRKAEELAIHQRANGKIEKKAKRIKKGENILTVENDLSKIFGTKVKIQGAKKGKLEVYFYSEEELDRIVNQMMKIL